jgi:hypothetical protein
MQLDQSDRNSNHGDPFSCRATIAGTEIDYLCEFALVSKWQRKLCGEVKKDLHSPRSTAATLRKTRSNGALPFVFLKRSQKAKAEIRKEGWLSGSLSKLRGDWTEAGKL